MNECARSREWLLGFVDGELTADQSEWMDKHLGECEECRAESAAFVAIDTELTTWGRQLTLKTPTRPGAVERLAARLAPLPVRSRLIRWIPALAATAVAGLVIAVIATTVAPHRKPAAVVSRDQTQFVGIPYLPPLDPRENTAIMRMNVRVATLLAVGYKIAADPSAVLPADVLVGEDGRAHAVRMLSDVQLN